MIEKKDCPVCGSSANFNSNLDTDNVFYVCPVCGRYELTVQEIRDFPDYAKLASFLYYNRFKSDDDIEYRYHTTMSKEKCYKYNQDFERGNNTKGKPVHMDKDIIDSWYPQSLAERIDCILLRLNALTKHIGQSIEIGNIELFSLLFIDRKERKNVYGSIELRNEEECNKEALYMLDALKASSFITYAYLSESHSLNVTITLTPQGYSRIDELQKYNATGRNALVAMKFGTDTVPLREAIRNGVKNAGYHAIFIDEVQHNDFITPELLKYIRDSKFVVADLSHQNNGAYFEEGYAMGIGKPVIQLCKRGVELHFDIAQKNTIMWDVEDNIPELIENRIKATID